MREARIHVRHIRDLLKSIDPADAYNGVDCNSMSFLNVVTSGDILGKNVIIMSCVVWSRKAYNAIIRISVKIHGLF